uniref:Uncharacterized protein n=1 Tax=Ciona savignyi TaxID=51511 RepID=H2YLJ0_CIOSA
MIAILLKVFVTSNLHGQSLLGNLLHWHGGLLWGCRHRFWCWFHNFRLAARSGNCLLLFRLNDVYVVRQGLLRSNLAQWVPWKHNFNLDSKNT